MFVILDSHNFPSSNPLWNLDIHNFIYRRSCLNFNHWKRYYLARKLKEVPTVFRATKQVVIWHAWVIWLLIRLLTAYIQIKKKSWSETYCDIDIDWSGLILHLIVYSYPCFKQSCMLIIKIMYWTSVLLVTTCSFAELHFPLSLPYKPWPLSLGYRSYIVYLSFL